MSNWFTKKLKRKILKQEKKRNKELLKEALDANQNGKTKKQKEKPKGYIIVQSKINNNE